MKKIIISLLIVALCVPALFACDEATGNMAESFPSTIPQVTPPASDSPVSDVQAVAKMYEVSQPTKVVAITKQVLIDGILELNCSYEMVTGYIDGLSAYVYKSSVEGVRSVEDGGRNDEVKPIKETSHTLEEYIEGTGVRVTTVKENEEFSGGFDKLAETKAIGKGKMAINLKDKYVEDVEYSDGTLSFTIPEKYVSSVLGKTYAKYISGDVKAVITNDGAQITSIELVYTISGSSSNNVSSSEMYVKVDYSYDIEKITIET